MLQRQTIITFFLLIHFSVQSQTWSEFIKQDAKDTLATGMPIAIGATALWYLANRIPYDWKNLTNPSSEFIYKTWEDQGFSRARHVLLKRIPHDSALSKIVVYTQELPGALAVGEPFIVRIESLLQQKEDLVCDLKKYPDRAQNINKKLVEIEDGLDECRFVCGHERVHKEYYHTYQLLVTQFAAPFVVYSFFKHVRMGIHKKWTLPTMEWTLQRSLARSTTELFIGWLRAQSIERNADLYASSDPKVLRAGLRLFKRALAGKVVKRSVTKPHQHIAGTVIGWVFRYTHPTLNQRIEYLTKHIEKLEKKNITEHHEFLAAAVKSQS